MTTKYKRSIIHYASVMDCEMVLDELKEELVNQLDDSTYQMLAQILDAKKNEISDRYNRK